MYFIFFVLKFFFIYDRKITAIVFVSLSVWAAWKHNFVLIWMFYFLVVFLLYIHIFIKI